MKSEAVVNTLAENTAEPFVTFDYKYILYAVVISGNGTAIPAGPPPMMAISHFFIIVSPPHYFLFPSKSLEPPPVFVT